MEIESLFPILSNLKPSGQAVLIQLFQHKVNDDVYASQANLSAWTGIKAKNTIKAAISELIDRGYLKCLKPGRQSAPALYRLINPAQASPPSTRATGQVILTSDNRLRLAAVKQGLPPAAWQEIKRESKTAGISEDDYLIKTYFGPERLHG